MTTLTIEEIEIGIRKSSDNSLRLFNDAVFLYRNKSYPTAYAIFQLASEEEAKVKLLIHLATRKRINNTITETEKNHYSKMFSGHQEKIRYSAGTDLAFIEHFPEHVRNISQELKRIKTETENPKNLDKLKQEALYVSIKNKKFKSPTDIIDKNKCNQMGLKVSDRIKHTILLMNFYFEDPSGIKLNI